MSMLGDCVTIQNVVVCITYVRMYTHQEPGSTEVSDAAEAISPLVCTPSITDEDPTLQMDQEPAGKMEQMKNALPYDDTHFMQSNLKVHFECEVFKEDGECLKESFMVRFWCVCVWFACYQKQHATTVGVSTGQKWKCPWGEGGCCLLQPHGLLLRHLKRRPVRESWNLMAPRAFITYECVLGTQKCRVLFSFQEHQGGVTFAADCKRCIPTQYVNVYWDWSALPGLCM